MHALLPLPVRPLLVVSTCALLLAAAFAAPVAAQTGSPAAPHYDLTVDLEPSTSHVRVRAVVTVPPDASLLEFRLGRTFDIIESSPAVERIPDQDPETPRGPEIPSDPSANARPARYRAKAPVRSGQLTLVYSGRLNFGLSAQKEEYTRGFRETAGIVGVDGVYLAGASSWYPDFGSGLLTFDLNARVPQGWHLVGQGDGTSRDETGVARWRSTAPLEEIYLVGGPLRVWRDRAGIVETLVYLHEDDAALAGKYLAATAQYLEMYRQLIGPYPYGKFALVENFWETGYGMPSFTLLGPSIIRFPFILTSSYPHEILHNWWGNSVFVDYSRGNWSEGLTAYLADHLLQEQRDRGADYRRATLQKYVNYVRDGRDFPLTEFRSRDSAATEAVGYGRTLMGVHMLRLTLGDEAFRRLLQRFYRDFRGRRASFDDLRAVAEQVGGRSLGPFFTDWVTRAGAPVLAASARAERSSEGWVVDGVVRQTQPGAAFAFDVPVTLQTTGPSVRVVARFDGAHKEAAFQVRSADPPVAVRADAGFDVFRALDAREIPPSIGQIFGAPRVTAVLPSAAAEREAAAWRTLVEGWRSDSHVVDAVLDADIERLPPDRPVWVLGRQNRFGPTVFADGVRVRIEGDALTMGGTRLPFAGHSAVIVQRHPDSADTAVGWIVNDVAAAFEGLGRKLPHYGRYSYLGFEGIEPTNLATGEWAPSESPLTIDLRPASGRAGELPPLAPARATPLAELPPTFSQKSLAEHVAWLASPEREGRGIGSGGLQQAASYIRAQFEKAGLAPGGENGTWFQAVQVGEGPEGRPASGVNVVGYLPGTNADFAGQSVLVTAHYDHLGRGWPEAHAEHAGVVHPGADDNASGVAVLIELARVFAASERPPRTIVFVAFTAEEAGLQGAKTYVSRPGRFPVSEMIGVINLDTVGRLGSGKVAILGAGTAPEWPHIFRGAGFVTGVESTSVPGNHEASDQRVFIEHGRPAVQVFTGPHADYHRPGDTADKVDSAGLVKVATLVREAVAYLAERPTFLTATTRAADRPASEEQAAPTQAGARRVSFGAVPDFTFQGAGVRLSDVTAGSPAARAGLQAGDVITRVEHTVIASLQVFADVLKQLAPGETITVTYQRGGHEQTVKVVVAER